MCIEGRVPWVGVAIQMKVPLHALHEGKNLRE